MYLFIILLLSIIVINKSKTGQYPVPQSGPITLTTIPSDAYKYIRRITQSGIGMIKNTIGQCISPMSDALLTMIADLKLTHDSAEIINHEEIHDLTQQVFSTEHPLYLEQKSHAKQMLVDTDQEAVGIKRQLIKNPNASVEHISLLKDKINKLIDQYKEKNKNNEIYNLIDQVIKQQAQLEFNHTKQQSSCENLYTVFIHSQPSYLYVPQKLYTTLWFLKYGPKNQLPTLPNEHFSFLQIRTEKERFDLTNNSQIIPYIQKMGLPEPIFSSIHKSIEVETVFTNYSLTGNIQRKGECSLYWCLKNVSASRYQVPASEILKTLNLPKTHQEFSKKIDELNEEYGKITKIGTIALIAIPTNEVDKKVILSDAYGVKKKLPITYDAPNLKSNINEQSVKKITTILRNQNPHAIVDITVFDEPIFIIPLASGILDPNSGIKIVKITEHTANPHNEEYKKFEQKYTQLESQIITYASAEIAQQQQEQLLQKTSTKNYTSQGNKTILQTLFNGHITDGQIETLDQDLGRMYKFFPLERKITEEKILQELARIVFYQSNHFIEFEYPITGVNALMLKKHTNNLDNKINEIENLIKELINNNDTNDIAAYNNILSTKPFMFYPNFIKDVIYEKKINWRTSLTLVLLHSKILLDCLIEHKKKINEQLLTLTTATPLRGKI